MMEREITTTSSVYRRDNEAQKNKRNPHSSKSGETRCLRSKRNPHSTIEQIETKRGHKSLNRGMREP